MSISWQSCCGSCASWTSTGSGSTTSIPTDTTDELIDVIASEPKIVKYLDIPIQHCNDTILKAMNRRDTKADLLALLKKLREKIPGLVLRTSLITGLPYEDDAAFEELCDFLREVKIERAGVFPFSPEEGTKAALMEHVDTEEAQPPGGAGGGRPVRHH